ncbi:MAG: M23 family metallopeptidase [Alphaproteobacteria bacterium]|nr:M23 family metallopeptidase [Alphaproteobacteria bacterium]
MEHGRSGRPGLARGLAVALAAWLAGCGAPSQPAPVFMKYGAPASGAFPAAPPPAVTVAGYRRVTVRRGQSLRTFARAHHVTPRAIIEANHLQRPYQLEAGTVLLVPERRRASARPRTIPLDRPIETGRPLLPPIAPPSGPVPAAESSPAAGPAPVEAVPLQPKLAPADPGPQTPPAAGEPAIESRPSSGAASDAAPPRRDGESRAEPVPHGGVLLWPVRGHVLASYGTESNGSRNDGINIAAPRGSPVRAVEAGTVAYAGNELRGYGNLVLLKHPDGLISAYAHCDEMLVKRGDKVVRGQVIARVGSSGSVSEPQLHFEIRRGNHPLDPREFLLPLPSAGINAATAEG